MYRVGTWEGPFKEEREQEEEAGTAVHTVSSG